MKFFKKIKSRLSTSYNFAKKVKREKYVILNQMAKAGQAVMVGDSIVELFPIHELMGDCKKMIYNRGIDGDTSDRLLERLDENVINLKPAIIFILIGTNDMSYFEEALTVENVRKIVIRLKSALPEAEIYLESVYPIHYCVNPFMVSPSRTNEKIVYLNKEYQKICHECNINYLNVYDAIKDKNNRFRKDLTYDGLHPDPNGYVVIADFIKKNVNFD